MTATRTRFLWVAAGLVWIGLAASGMTMVMRYDTTPGAPAHAPLQWPAGSRLTLAVDRPTLIVLAHPRCDCTRASLTEIAELLARASTPPRTYVVFIDLPDVEGGWEDTSTWAQAQAIEGVEVVRDRGGREARRFGVETSGQVLMFLPDGRLTFSGGTTSARGKAGPSVGRTTLLDLIDGRATLAPGAPVYGCPLFGPADAAAGDDEHAG